MRLVDSYSSFRSHDARESNRPTFNSVDLDRRRSHNDEPYSGKQDQFNGNQRNGIENLGFINLGENGLSQDGFRQDERINPSHHSKNQYLSDSNSLFWKRSLKQLSDYSINQQLNQRSDQSSQRSNQLSNQSLNQSSNQLNGQTHNGNGYGHYNSHNQNGNVQSMYEQPSSLPDSYHTSDCTDLDSLFEGTGGSVNYVNGINSVNSINSHNNANGINDGRSFKYSQNSEDGSSRNSLDSCSIYIGNVEYGANPLDLQRHFKSCGVVERITIMANKETGQPKGYAYLEFDLHVAAKDAVKMFDGSELLGREIKVCLKRTNVPGHSHAGHGYYRGRGRGRGGRKGRRARGGSRSNFSPY